MPTYALLGATGSTGSAILRCLLSEPPKDLTLNVFIRDKSKLLKAFPDLEHNATFKVKIIEGTPDNAPALQECLLNTDAVFACIASNVSTPDLTLVHDTADAIVAALKIQHQAQTTSYKTPTILQIRSGSLDPNFKAHQGQVGSFFPSFAFHYAYADLQRACDLYAEAAKSTPGLLQYIFMDPGSLHDADGTTRTGHELVLDGSQSPMINYADLGAGFCEAAERRGEFAGKAVGVSATGKVFQTWGTLMGYMATGVKGRVWG